VASNWGHTHNLWYTPLHDATEDFYMAAASTAKSDLPGTTDAPVAAQIREVLVGLCGALSAMIDRLPVAIERAADLERALSIDAPLAWRVFRIARAEDPAEAVAHLPTVNQLRRAVSAAAGLAPARVVEDAVQAVDKLAAMASTLGGDQRGFESLVSSLSPGGVKRVELQHRRSAFRANTHLWGIHVRCLSVVAVIHPNKSTGEIDGYFVHGYHDIRPTRPNVPIVMRSRLKAHEVGTSPTAPAPIVSMDTDYLDNFSTLPRPALAEMEGTDGFVETRIQFRGLSPSDAETLTIGRYVTRAFLPGEDVCDLKMIVTWPCEMLHADILIPTGLTDPATTGLELYANRDEPPKAFELRRDDRVPLHEQTKVFRGIETPPPAAAYPRLREVFDSVVETHGWGGGTYDLYRVQVPFPMMHGLVRWLVRPRR
jgi:hypothetical protein